MLNNRVTLNSAIQIFRHAVAYFFFCMFVYSSLWWLSWKSTQFKSSQHSTFTFNKTEKEKGKRKKTKKTKKTFQKLLKTFVSITNKEIKTLCLNVCVYQKIFGWSRSTQYSNELNESSVSSIYSTLTFWLWEYFSFLRLQWLLPYTAHLFEYEQCYLDIRKKSRNTEKSG